MALQGAARRLLTDVDATLGLNACLPQRLKCEIALDPATAILFGLRDAIRVMRI